MLLLAHTGITLGIFNLLRRVFSRISLNIEEREILVRTGSPMFPPRIFSNPDPPENYKKWHIDYRFVLLGSVFPDVIDKPLGMILFAGMIANGRIYTHTFLVNLILVLVGIYLLKKKKINFLMFSLCSCFHLVLDKMWLNSETLFWPLYGWGFPKEDISHWWENMLQSLLANPWAYVPEVIGAIILITFGLTLIKRKTVSEFLSKGTTK